MRKLYALLLPVLALVAFASVTAAASAAPEYELCKEVTKETGKFTTIGCTTEKAKSNFEKELVGNLSNGVVTTSKNKSGTVAVLKAGESGIECTVVADEAYIFNRAGVGRDLDEISFTKCKATGALASCTVAEPIEVEANTILEETGGVIFNKLTPPTGEPFTEVDLTGTGCPGKVPVTGTVKGEFTGKSGKIEKFKGGELKFGTTAAEFEAEIENEGPKGAGIFLS